MRFGHSPGRLRSRDLRIYRSGAVPDPAPSLAYSKACAFSKSAAGRRAPRHKATGRGRFPWQEVGAQADGTGERAEEQTSDWAGVQAEAALREGREGGVFTRRRWEVRRSKTNQESCPHRC